MSLNPPWLPRPTPPRPRDALKAHTKHPHVPPDLVAWLKEAFPPRCIGRTESEADARYYAAQHELAQRLIRMGEAKSAAEGEITMEAYEAP